MDRREFVALGITAAAMAGAKPAWAKPAVPGDLAGLTVKRSSELLRSRAVSPVDLTQACLARIAKLNPELNAYITVTGDQALARAREMEAEIHKKWRGPLHGVPIALKDNIDTAGVRTTAASELFKDRVPTEDAEVVRRLKNAGAVILGKLNMHEFADGITSAVSFYGPVHNSWALDRVPGGSSGGSAAATSADMCIASLGTDTAGSVRIPSSFCGVVGLKGTYGRVSIRGIIPLSWSLDHCGPICKTVEDTALMLNAIAGYDQMDPTTVNEPVSDYARAIGAPVSKFRLGIPRAPFFDSLDPEVASAVDDAIGVLRKMTASAVDVKIPIVRQNVLGPEAYAYHAKWLAESPQLYQPRTRVALSRSADSKAPAYAEALHGLNIARRAIVTSFANIDLLVTPTMPDPPATIAEAKTKNVGSTRNTAPFDGLGLPAITVPCGFTKSDLPIGLQIAGAPFAESNVIALAHAYEQATEWHKRKPKL